MKIGIYNEPAGAAIGGTEYTAAVLAEALGKQNQVEIVHHRPSLTSSLLAETFALNLNGVRMRHVPYEDPHNLNGHGRWSRYQQLKTWHANLSEPYDLFINFTHRMPPFCHARFGALVVLFPMFEPFNTWPWIDDSPHNASFLRKHLRCSYYEWEWRKRFQSYRVKLAISQFAKKWTKNRWRVDCQVLYPPVDTRFCTVDKANIILSVGRFGATGVKKNQLELAMAFRRLAEENLRGWKFICVGPLSDSVTDLAYFKEVRRIAATGQSEVVANVEYWRLRKLYEQAKIFWHATGYGNDENLNPELQEHFGIVTVEAMAAGCVPVVINGGGQRELVEHGISGFLWNNLDELVDYTVRLANDDGLRTRMSTAARIRSQSFDRNHFVNRFRRVLHPFLK